jgi:hypothetical protein
MLLEKVQKIREKSSSPEKWNSSELSTMIQWYCSKGYAKIPTTVAERRQRYLDTATVAAAGIEIAASDEVAASDDDTSEALVLLQHEV